MLAAPGCFGQDTAGVGSVSGTVRDGDSKPIIGARVCAGERCSTTDGTGAFRLPDLRSGSYRLEINAAGFPAVSSQDVEVRAGLDDQVAVTMPRLDAVAQSVTVSDSVFVAAEEIKTSGYLVTRSEVLKSAGTLQDVPRYIQSLPGVVLGSNDFRNDLIVRGGSPLENLYIVDNIEIPNINTFANFASAGGTVSILDAELLQDVTFLSGGYPAPFINRTSSVLQVTQREGSRDGFAGRATVGFAGAGTVLEGPIRQGKGSWVVSARRSFLDLFTDDTGIGGVPVLYTFNAKAVYDLTARDRIWAVNVTGVDRIRLGLTENSDPDEELSSFDIRYRGTRSATGVNWQHLFGSRGVGLLGVTHSEARVRQSIRDLLRNGAPAPGLSPDEIIATSPTVFDEDSREGESTLKYDLTAYAPMLGKLQTGGSFKVFGVGYNTASPYGTDSPYSLTRDINPFTLRTNFTTVQTGAYLQSSRDLTRRLNVTWGGRFDRYQYVGETRLSPRAGISYRLTDRLSWRASYGQYFQQPFLLFLSAFPVNRDLTPIRSTHYVTGVSYQVSDTLRVTVEAYRKIYKDYPVALQFPSLSLAGVGDTFNVRDILFPLTSAGRGRAQGIELFVEKKFTDRWFGQANLSFSRSRQAGLDGIQRPNVYDYPRVFNAVGGYRLNRKWELSGRLTYLSGRPYTPFDESLSTEQRRGIFDLTQVNAVRLPAYFRVDVRVDRTFIVRDKPLLVFAGAQNITNRKNIGGFTWNRYSNAIQFNDQLGIFPLVGMDWRF